MIEGMNEALDISKNETVMDNLQNAFNDFLKLLQESCPAMGDPSVFFGMDVSRAQHGIITVIYDDPMFHQSGMCFCLKFEPTVENENAFIHRFKALLFDIAVPIITDTFMRGPSDFSETWH